jgi:hypothetical protein
MASTGPTKTALPKARVVTRPVSPLHLQKIHVKPRANQKSYNQLIPKGFIWTTFGALVSPSPLK